jgi:hypothetical protein
MDAPALDDDIALPGMRRHCRVQREDIADADTFCQRLAPIARPF